MPYTPRPTSDRSRRLAELIRLAAARSNWRWKDGAAVHRSGHRVWLGEDGYFRCISETTCYILPQNAMRGVEELAEHDPRNADNAST